MAKQNEVIEPQRHYSQSIYTSWLRKIGAHTYRFKHVTRNDGYTDLRVDRSLGFKRGWETVHHWTKD